MRRSRHSGETTTSMSVDGSWFASPEMSPAPCLDSPGPPDRRASPPTTSQLFANGSTEWSSASSSARTERSRSFHQSGFPRTSWSELGGPFRCCTALWKPPPCARMDPCSTSLAMTSIRASSTSPPAYSHRYLSTPPRRRLGLHSPTSRTSSSTSPSWTTGPSRRPSRRSSRWWGDSPSMAVSPCSPSGPLHPALERVSSPQPSRSSERVGLPLSWPRGETKRKPKSASSPLRWRACPWFCSTMSKGSWDRRPSLPRSPPRPGPIDC